MQIKKTFNGKWNVKQYMLKCINTRSLTNKGLKVNQIKCVFNVQDISLTGV